jgi:hypothetical protein
MDYGGGSERGATASQAAGGLRARRSTLVPRDVERHLVVLGGSIVLAILLLIGSGLLFFDAV